MGMRRAWEPHIDAEAARLLRYERFRHTTAVERLAPGDLDAILREIELHHEEVHEIMSAHALRWRQRRGR